MENFSNHRPSFPGALPQSPDLGYPPPQPVLVPPDQYQNKGGQLRGLLTVSDADANRLGVRLNEAWPVGIKKEEFWESCEGAADDFCYANANDCHLKADMSSYASYEARSKEFYDREANVSHLAGDCSQPDLSDYLGREEDLGSSCGSGEDQIQSAGGVEEPWISDSASFQRRRGVASTQKLDSFSEAFLPQRRKTFSLVPSGESSASLWESLGFNPDSYVPPSSSSSPIFPSPPASSHLMPSVLSPPPTPRPPPALSPVAFRATGHPSSHGGDSVDALQFFTSHLQALPSIYSSGTMWALASGDPHITGGDLRSGHGGDFQSVAASPGPPFLSSLRPPSFTPSSLHPSLHCEAAAKLPPYMVSQKAKNGSGRVNQSQLRLSQIYTGTPFPSILQSSRDQKKGRYTPPPLLDPSRTGVGLYSSLSSLHHRRGETSGGQEGGAFPCVNVGQDFQAELPQCSEGREESEDESPWEQLLWKPLDDLEESADLQDRVDQLLSVCSSSCLPGGGSNVELALHCLHRCEGNILDTLDLLLFSCSSLTGTYHYSGSDVWTDGEKLLFSAALGTYGKEFSLVQKTVRTKTTGQCVEFFYLSKKLQDKQKESRDGGMEQTSVTPTSRRTNRQVGLELPVPAPSLASFFPCKLCGKMFYKIKSRNAHMKIHRQSPEDWTDRPAQLLAQRLGGPLLQPQVPGGRNPSSVVTYGNLAMSNTHVIDEGGATTAPSFGQLWGSLDVAPPLQPLPAWLNRKKEEAGRWVETSQSPGSRAWL
ncbi:transcriptional-regulating factor 1-like isoform X2 [Antennarius striatus]|uniref:transcriptional-regulating factor 1-like isoform X2 n=1 Tax=Antennarius striatus TaxID=241820 RepID=UPI0035AF7D08